ncbi:hypothetical protein RESH_03353 [Rhodopirellula europaea SH398]|uniref:Uncharacterized protein n=1 Tax=Rhodopirellula europaea SH398 TaxID=1263868 RepID=M5S3H3_9BACT|nr:hypothetical protein RESH_03353 [Rhodopirellula europaea SH398]
MEAAVSPVLSADEAVAREGLDKLPWKVPVLPLVALPDERD